ncbi:MAG: glucose-6-phosphate isomerase [bacterium]
MALLKENLEAEPLTSQSFVVNLHELQPKVLQTLQKMQEENVIARIWSLDHTIWKSEPAEITNRLGWLRSPQWMTEKIAGVVSFVESLRQDGFTHALLLGMGGSSLAPEVFKTTFGVKSGYLDLAVLDSTDPQAVLAHTKNLDLQKTLFIVSTKSGGTVETLSFFKYCFNLVVKALGWERVGEHFIAITDPGSSLVELAHEYRFRETFLNDPNIGGRYSVLSYFGLLPAGLLGLDLNRLLERTYRMAENCRAENDLLHGDNTAVWLGAIMGALANAGRDKLTLVASPALAHFGVWAEQLVAESTGKDGTGILPVNGEDLAAPEFYGLDRLFVYLKLAGDDCLDEKIDKIKRADQPVVQLLLQDVYDLGGEFFRWELATAVAGHILRVNPFDQPNVESAKVQARKMVETYQEQGELPQPSPTFEDGGISVFTDLSVSNLKQAMSQFLANASTADGAGKKGDYLALQAYVHPTEEARAALHKIRLRLRDKYKLPTTVGFGPRFLHSTGQLHKGDAGNGLFIQITADSLEDVDIPDKAGAEASSISFGVLKLAQALGDRRALLDAGRKVIRFHLGTDVLAGLKRLEQVLA